MPEPTTSAAVFFRDTFAGADPFAEVTKLVTAKADENEWREFKSAAWFDAPRRTPEIIAQHNDDVKKYWSENLGAFANMGDGVLIWGIDAPKDRAENESLPANAQALADRLRELHNTATDPLVNGVQIRVATAPNSSRGFVVCYIPKSLFAPHLSKWAPGGYYMRAQSSNVQMPPEMLRRMFYPQTSPRLVPTVTLRFSETSDHKQYPTVRIDLRNEGMASARDTFIDFSAIADGTPQYNLNENVWRRRYAHLTSMSQYQCVATIHPGEPVVLLEITFAGGAAFHGRIDNPIRCELRIFAEHAPALLAVVEFDVSEMRAALHSRQKIERRASISELTSLQP